jgi:hypothetical protein
MRIYSDHRANSGCVSVVDSFWLDAEQLGSYQLVRRISTDKRIIKGRPLEVDFDRSHQRLQQGAPS